MDPSRIIADLCQRFGVSQDFGRRLKPLVERAARSEPEKRRRMLELVERSFAEEARRADEQRVAELTLAPEERRVLTTIARALHHWQPPRWLDDWEDHARGRRPDGGSP